MASKGQSHDELSPRDLALRAVAESRLKSLRLRSEKILCHLRSPRGENDARAMFFLLHQIEVEYNDLLHNLKKSDYVPKPGKARRTKLPKDAPKPKELPRKAKGPQPGPSTFVICCPVENAELENMGQRDGRNWCSAPLVEAILPVRERAQVLKALAKFKIEDEAVIVRSWAETTFGSLEQAREALAVAAKLDPAPEVWRGLLAGAKDPSQFDGLSDAELLQDRRAIATARMLHSAIWVGQTLKSIKESAKGKADLDTLDRRVRAALGSFHTAVNSGRHTNPQFSYLSLEKSVATLADVRKELDGWFVLPESERYAKDDEDDRKRHRLTILQKELGAARRAAMPKGSERKQRWGGRPILRGMVSRSSKGVLLWDNEMETNGLVLALPIGGAPPIDQDRYRYIDGRNLHSDRQLLNDSGKGKGCIVMPLRLKHDFLRWHVKHIDNHEADASKNRRCQQKSFQFVIVDADGAKPRLFIRPIFKFYQEEVTVANTHEYFKKPGCRYLVGIDVGINYVFRAVVFDTECKAIIDDIPLAGRKEEWRELRSHLAFHQQQRAYLRAQNAPAQKVERQTTAIRALRKQDRGLGHTEAVEAAANLVETLEREYGAGNYCLVMEDLDFGSMNLKRNNRVKHLAAIRDAFTNQLRKRGYKYLKSGKVDGLRFEIAFYTSQVSPFGWWAKKDEVERVWKEEKQPIGRRVGNWYERRNDDKPCRRGCYVKPEGRGMPKFVVEDGDKAANARRRPNFGSELFWDPYVKSFKGVDFENGCVLDADFVGAFNLAVRPLVKDGKGKGFTVKDTAEAHTRLNPTVEIACKLRVFEITETCLIPKVV